MERNTSWLLFSAPTMAAAMVGLWAARGIREDASLDWVFAVTLALVGAIAAASIISWGVRRQLKIAAAEAAAGRSQLTATLPGLLPLLFQLREVRGQASDQSDAVAQLGSRLTSVLQAMQDGVLAVDGDDRIIFANHVATEMLQLPARFGGRHILQAARDHRVLRLVERCRNSGRLAHDEFSIGNNGALIELLATPLMSNAEDGGGVVVVLRDTTELKRLESVRRDFVTNVSHELKTPLSNIKLYAETLANGAMDDLKVRDGFLAKISEQAERLSELIIDLISLAQIESGKQAFEMTRVSVEKIVESCLIENQAAINEGEITIETNVPVDAFVHADEEGVRQIVSNLLTNALKYTAGGVVAIHADVTEEHVEIRVEDTGIGIPAEHLDRLFERFYRVDRARARQLGGTGLGLSIVKHLASAFDGSVGVESEVGKGSTFWVRLPLSRPPVTHESRL